MIPTNTGPQKQKRHRMRTPWACNQCRMRKVKCEDGDGTKCAGCIGHNLECSGKKETRQDTEAKALEKKLRQMESILGRRIEGHGSDQVASSSSFPPLSSKDAFGIDQESEEDSGDLHRTNSRDKKQLVLKVHDDRFPGQSSDVAFLNQVLDIKQSTRRRQNYAFPFSENLWQALPWEYSYFADSPIEYSFPEADLLFSLIDLFFEHFNIHLGLLHRPSFLASVSEGLHIRNTGFAQVVLLVAAIGSRYSNDPRVLIGTGQGAQYSSGWKWYTQVEVLSKTFMRPPTLYDLQKLVLAATYLFGSSMPPAVWTLAGIGLRFAQDRGIHRQKKPGHVWTVEDELWKRAFWLLILCDRISSSVLGTPLGIRVEDYDVELPVTCDEEYWVNADPKRSFRQPEGLPSKQMHLALTIRLTDVLEFTHRTLYAVGKFKTFLGKSNPHWAEDILQMIDSSLNKWKDAIPEYLRWPASDVDTVLYYQSASLHINYHFARIQAHRPFIPSLIGYSGFSTACLVVCANAARSCSHIFGTLSSRPMGQNNQYSLTFALTSGIFLLLYIWEAEKFGLPINTAQELQNARHCVDFLRSMANHFMVAAQFANWLDQLVSQEEASTVSSVPRGARSASLLAPNIDTPPDPQITPKQPPPMFANAFIPQDHQPTVENSRSPDDFMNPFGAFTNETVFGDGLNDIWGNTANDIAMLRGLGTEDEFYRNIFASFNNSKPMGNG